MRFPAGTSVLVLRPGAKRRHGERAPGTQHVITGAAVSTTRVAASEGDDRGSQLTHQVVLLLPPGADVRSDDQVKLPTGELYDVVGDPVPRTSPLTGWAAGSTVQLLRKEG